MTWIGQRRPDPSPYGALQSAAYSAPCPGCTGDADWHASAVSASGDISHTTVTYRIDCSGCGPVVAKEIA